jgi:RNA-binding protein 15
MIESLQNIYIYISFFCFTYWSIMINTICISGKIVPTNCLWVGNIPIDMKRRDLEQAFTRYGQIKSFDYSNGDPIAIVSYNEIEDAIKARGKMTGVTEIIEGRKVRTESDQSDSSRRAGLRIDYLDRPTARRFVIVRPQDNTIKRRTSQSTSVSSASSVRSSKDRVRSISNDDQPDNKISKRQSRSPSASPPPPPPPPPSKRRSLSPPTAGHTFYGPFGSYFSSDETTNINNISDLITFCEKLNSSSIKTNPNFSTVYPVQFILKSHAYDARMHFLAGNPQLANKILGQRGDQKTKPTELKVTQRLRLDQHKLEDLEKKLRNNISSISSKSHINGQSSNTSLANQTKFAVLITSPITRGSNEYQRKSNGKTNSSDENDDRLQTKDDDDESSLSRLISYLAVKEAAGVITVPFDNDHETAALNIFPPCQFSKKFLRVICPSMSFSNGPRTPPSRPTTTINDEHLMVVIVHND